MGEADVLDRPEGDASAADPTRQALEWALHLAREQVGVLEAALARREPGDEWVPVKVAAHHWGCSPAAALKRAQRGRGTKLPDGRWYFPASFVAETRIPLGNVHPKCPDASR